MKIGELARRSGVTAKTIRFYESEGLLPNPPRTSSGYRAYAEEDAARLEFILEAQRVGLSLDNIKGILALHDRNEPTCVHVLALLEEKLEQVDNVIRDLQRFRGEIERLCDEASDLVDCKPMGGDICAIIEGSGIKVSDATLVRVDPLRSRA